MSISLYLTLMGCIASIHCYKVTVFIITLLSCCLGGVTALDAVDYGVRWFVVSLPTKLPTIALESILFRGWNLLNPEVWHSFIVQSAWFVGLFLLMSIAFYRGKF